MFNRVFAAAAVVSLGASPLMACLVNGKLVGCDTPLIGCHASPSSWTGGDLERPVLQPVLSEEPVYGDTVIVHVFNNEFSINPEGLPIEDPVISPGTTIRWVWDRGFHDVTALNGSSENFIPSQSVVPPYEFEYTFFNPGVFTYYCTIHGTDLQNGTATGMVGTVTITPEPAAISAAAMAVMGLRRRR